MARSLKRLHNEELHNLYGSPNTVLLGAIKSRRMTWAGHAAHTRHAKCIQNSGKKTYREEHSEDLGVGGKIILK